MKSLEETFEHAQLRAKERYGLDIELKDWKRLNTRIQMCRHASFAGMVLVEEEIDNNQSIWWVPDFMGHNVLVTYNHQREMVTTFMFKREER